MHDLWPNAERWLLGNSRPEEAGGLESSIQPTWSIPPDMALVAVLVAAVIFLVIYWHESAAAGRPWKVMLAGIPLRSSGGFEVVPK